MKKIIFFLSFFYTLSVYGNDLFIVNINLCEDKLVTVNVKLGNKTSFDENFCFLDYVPGNYEKSYSTAFINNAKATYKNGSIKKVNIKGNKLILSQPKNILEISYQVNQYNQKTGKSYDFPAAGNIFDSNKMYLLNFHAFIGFNNQKCDADYSVIIHKDEIITGFGSLIKQSTSEKIDTFATVNFQDLIDAPMFYSLKTKHQLFTIKSMNTEISFLINSNLQIDSSNIKKKLSKILETLEKSNSYQGFMPEKYNILVLHDPNINGYEGALEHPTSSIYFFKSQKIDELTMLKTICHEILHIKFPLAIKSDVTSKLNNQEQSKHLWLYEGVTEYLSLKLCLASEIIDTNTFFVELYKKSLNTRTYSNFNMLQLSSNVLSKEGSINFSNFYDNGALFAFLIDVKLYLAKKNGINEMLEYISQNTDSMGVFNETNLIQNIETKFPVLIDCFEREINNQISLENIFDSIGIIINSGCSVEESFTYDFQINKAMFFRKNLFAKTHIVIMNSPINTQSDKKKMKVYLINNEPVTEQSFKKLINTTEYPETIVLNDELSITRSKNTYHKKTYIVDKELFISEFGKYSILTF